ncbi:hypothetical protein MASR2M8_12910 [Opitutaceae bacterium]
MIDYTQPDLTRHPPRSPSVRLGGFVHLPRLLDKTRAVIAGRQGEYQFPCPLDERFFAFTGITPAAFIEAVRSGQDDSAMLAWVRAQLTPARSPAEIVAWSDALAASGADNVRRHAYFGSDITRLAAGRDDIHTAFDRLDLDDYVSFGGRG